MHGLEFKRLRLSPCYVIDTDMTCLQLGRLFLSNIQFAQDTVSVNSAVTNAKPQIVNGMHVYEVGGHYVIRKGSVS